ncbi:PREDICTED: aquaporin-12-like isoform X2 [Branchiostoma belcheri]|uniref:Aquaporin-12-like isoform X2 n=1 Tax=Branchiostoma belcheri TaxID=7741 RepID=A0A6P4ZHD6_BRABE|nr:PREDICTED: aquaporin-12-like isoform X2 [Branchiostoma belcheri]
MAVLVSIGFMVVTFAIAQVLRIVGKVVLPSNIYEYWAELITTWQFCACFIETDFVTADHGWWMFAVVCFLMCLGFCKVFEDATGCPCCVLEDYMGNLTTVKSALIKVAVQIAGAILAARWAYFVWTLGYSAGHADKAREELCETCINCSDLEGMAAEGLATFTAQFAAWKLKESDLSDYINSALCVAIIVTGASWTGMMFNPALAVSMTYGCKGESIIDHVVVYWIGPLIATALSYYLHFGTVPVLQAEKVKTT